MNFLRYGAGLLFGILSLGQNVQAAPAGQLDPTFGIGGLQTVSFNEPSGDRNDQATAMVKAADGRIYLVGPVNIAPFQYATGVTRLTPDGVIDATFGGGTGRRVLTHPNIPNIYVTDAALQSSGSIVIVGGGGPVQSPRPIACALKADGSFDTTFGSPQTPGCRVVDSAPVGQASGVAIQSNGRIVMAGQVAVGDTTQGIVVRLTSGGALDTSFDFDGVRTPFDWMGKNNLFNDVALAPNGDIVLAGAYAATPQNWDFFVGRLLPSSGQTDMPFGDGSGYNAIKFDGGPGNDDKATAVTVLANGSILIAGYSRVPGDTQYRAAVAKLTSAGKPDGLWNGAQGKRVYDPCSLMPSGCDMRANDILVMADGRVAIAGSLGTPGNPATNDLFAMRLAPNSVPDNAFGTLLPGQAGTAIVAASALQDEGTRLLAQGSKIVLAGSATVLPGSAGEFAIARLDNGDNTVFSVSPTVVGNGTITPDSPQLVTHSTHVKFTLTPSVGYTIKSVTGCDGGLVGNVYTTGPITQSCQVVATFASHVTLTYSTDGNGIIQGPNPQVIPYNTNGLAVTAVPALGYEFHRWSDYSLDVTRTDLAVKQDISVTALFLPKVLKLSGKLMNAGGKVIPHDAKPVGYGQTDSIIIQPDPGFGVASTVPSENCNGVLVGNAYVVSNMINDCQVSITFEPSSTVYQLSYEPGLHCTIDGNTEQAVASGFNGTEVVVTPKEGYVFLQWSDGNKNAARTDTHVFNHVDVTAQCAPAGQQVYVVTPQPASGGVLLPPGPQLVAAGSSFKFDAAPAPGFKTTAVFGCGNGVFAGNAYITAPITADCVVAAKFDPSAQVFSLTYAAGEGGLVQGNLAQQVAAGGSGSPVTAVANPGRYFVQWSDGKTANPRKDVHVAADVNVTAQFAAEGTFTVESVAGLDGTISPSGIQVVNPGAILEFIVTPNPGFAIDAVEGCGGTLVGKVYTTAPVNASCKILAGFVATDASYLLTYAAGPNGSINGSAEQVVVSGGSGTPVTAMPANGYIFLQWSDGSTMNPRQDTGVIADIDVTAQFVLPGDLIVTPTAGPGGSIVPGIAQVVTAGDVLQFDILPNPGVAIAGVAGTCGGTLEGNVYTTAPVVASCTVDASFVASDEVYTLKYTAGANGQVNGAAVVQQDVISGGSGNPVQAQPAPGFFFVQWSDGSQQNPRVDTHVVQNIDVTAQFALNGNFVVTPMAGPGGKLVPGIAQVVAPGGVAQFAVQPAPGFIIGTVSGCGGNLVGNTFTTAAVQANCDVQATFKASNAVFELSYLAGFGGSIQGDVSQQVPAGGNGEPVTAEPNPGFQFVKWSDGWIEALREDTNVTGDITVTAEFADESATLYTVTPSWGPGGALSPDIAVPVVEGDNALFTVLPNPGFAIESVTGCDGSLVGNTYVTAPVMADCDVHATFVASNATFTLTYTAGPNGQVNGQAQVQVVVPAGGQGVEVTAQPANGFVFVQWSDGGLSNPRLDTNVASDISVTAQFAPVGALIHTVLPLSGAGGALVPPIAQKIADGATAKFTVQPNEGFIIASVGGTCGGSLVGNLYTTNPVTGDCTVEASFVASDEIFTLTYVAGPNGLVNGQAIVVQNVPAGGSAQIVQAQPAQGFVFVQWSDGWTEIERQDTNVVGDMEVTAQFAPVNTPIFVVTPIAGANGALSPASELQVPQGEVAVFDVLPNPGYAVDSIGGTCGGTLENGQFTTDPIVADCTVEVTFFNDRIFYNGFGTGDEQQ